MAWQQQFKKKQEYQQYLLQQQQYVSQKFQEIPPQQQYHTFLETQQEVEVPQQHVQQMRQLQQQPFRIHGANIPPLPSDVSPYTSNSDVLEHSHHDSH